MLILTRTVGQRLIITTESGETITVQIVSSRGPVKVGVEAPKSITVDREEIHVRKVAEGKSPATNVASAIVRAVADPRRDPSKRVTRDEARAVGAMVAESLLPTIAQPQAE